jgi:hypothetical protein
MRSKRPLTIGALVAILIGVGVALGAFRTAAPAASPTPFAAITQSPTASPTVASSLATTPRFDNAVLGYSISVPAPYRLASSAINAGQPEQLGSDAFSVRSVAEDRADCLSSESPGIGSIVKQELVVVAVIGNVRGLSAMQWATGSAYGRLHTVEASTVGGYDAARLVQQGIADAYVISANDRMYVVSHQNSPSSQRLADIAASFRALTPTPFPTAPPAQVARDAASNLGQRLAQAFAAKDADAVAGLMTDCRISAGENVGGSPLGTEGISRSSSAFITALRERFAKGDLAVTVNPAVQVQAVSGQFFVRSDWKEPDRTTPIDLLFRELDGRWQWTSAIHYYPSLVGSGCIPYRSPWTASPC